MPAADREVVRGIAAYRRHPYTRHLPDPPAIWTEGGSALLDFGGDGPPVLFVPSLVNRASVLDLLPGASMMRFLAAHGVRPLLLDWGWPGALEAGFTLADYAAGRLVRAIGAIGQPIVLAGYCMGGLLALVAAGLRPDRVRGLALLATPWDFHAERALPSALPVVDSLIAAGGLLPVDAISALFALADPGGAAARYRAFAAMDQGSPAAERFVALEDWASDGVPVAGAVARECLDGWYGRNTPARNMWCILGQPVRPDVVTCPVFIAVPSGDRIVPPGSALALAAAMPQATVQQPAAGHVGMVCGSRAEQELWRPLLGWLHGP